MNSSEVDERPSPLKYCFSSDRYAKCNTTEWTLLLALMYRFYSGLLADCCERSRTTIADAQGILKELGRGAVVHPEVCADVWGHIFGCLIPRIREGLHKKVVMYAKPLADGR